MSIVNCPEHCTCFPQVVAANNMAVGLQKLHKLRRMILDMDRWTIAEIRSYSRPPPVVHTVLQAALLLLGEDERTTSVSSTHSNTTHLAILLKHR